MKKSLKLLTAMLLAVVMTLSLVTVAAAEEAEGEMDPETFKGSITVDKGSYEALFFAEAQTLAPIRARLVFGFSGEQIGN